MDFRNHFNNFWKTFYLNPFEIRPLKTLGAPGAVHTHAPEEPDRWARDPTGQSPRGGGALTARFSPSMWPDELGIELAGAHGGAAALAHGGRSVQATVVADEARARLVRWRQT
jgi:hypothetical protein